MIWLPSKSFVACCISFTLLLSWGCSKDNTSSGPAYDVNPIFEPYVQQFIEEGKKRGVDIDFSDSGLKIELSEKELEFAGGFCYLGEHHIVINKTVWQQGNEEYKTRLIFHELGHCELGRLHKNDRFTNNQVWKSIMRGDPLNAAERRIPVPFFGFRMEYYVDELFNPLIDDPQWSKVEYKFEDIADEQKVTLHSDTLINRFTKIFQDLPEEYEIDVQFRLSTVPAQSTQLTWGTTGFKYLLTIWPQNLFTINAVRNETNIFLFRENNTLALNDRNLDHITIRVTDNATQIFMNELFFFHVDPLPGPLTTVRFESLMNLTNELNLQLDIKNITISAI